MKHRISPLLTLAAGLACAAALTAVATGRTPTAAATGQAPGPAGGPAAAAADPRAAGSGSAEPGAAGSGATGSGGADSGGQSARVPADGRGALAGPAGYEGRTRDGALTVSVAVRAGRAAAYLCDGDRVETWLRGRVRGDRLRLTGDGGVLLVAVISGDQVAGTVLLGDRTHPFRAARATRPSAALLERVGG